MAAIVKIFSILFLIFSVPVMAEPTVSPSVEDNIREMDKDRNGLVTVSEVRVYLESMHGKGYEKDILDKMEASSGASCGTTFAKSFY
ncbi:hypothetical protein MTYP_00638 [Methylophilaceae bacterium]|nr:hypothetical protein MTYP_00638 [Methylophilaceae bacterium]